MDFLRAARVLLAMTLIGVQLNSTICVAGPRCANVFSYRPSRPLMAITPNGVEANGVLVTGHGQFPAAFVLENLRLPPTEVSSRLREKVVISLGEGTSGLLPYLLREGVQARGVDVWYHSESYPDSYVGDLMEEYVQEYAEQLIRADARRVPLPDSSVDMVVSHMLVSNFSLARQRSMLRETLRLLKAGGEARIFGFSDDDARSLTTFLQH